MASSIYAKSLVVLVALSRCVARRHMPKMPVIEVGKDDKFARPHSIATQISSMAAGLAAVRMSSGLLQVSESQRSHPPASDRKGIFCYTLVRTPPEPTVALWEKQAAAACDGWATYGHEGNTLLHVTRAYSQKQEEHGWAHQQEDMVVRGAWQQLAETGDLWKYAWIVKFDTDSFIRPSTLRKNLLRYDHTKASTVSVSDTTEKNVTIVEGFFIAVSAALVDKVYPLARADGNCDPRSLYEFTSGHNNEEVQIPNRGAPCMETIGFEPEKDHYAFRDEKKQLMVAQAQDGEDAKRCKAIADKVLDHYGSSKGPLCECRPGGSLKQQCYSENFAIVHPVKDLDQYEKLVAAFL